MPSDRELLLVRDFDAPRELLWKVWTEPQHLARWWGPTGFSTTTHAHDASEGGSWRSTMHGPDGHDYPNHIEYTEFRAPEFLAYRHVDVPEEEPSCFRAEATFEQVRDDPPRTRVSFRMIFDTPEDLKTVAERFGAGEGAVQTFNRLGRHVAALTNPDADTSHVITRHFDAPRELVYEAWTRVEHLSKWFGPKHAPVGRCSLDFRVGGAFHYEMDFPEAPHWGKSVFTEIVPGRRLVSVMSFADELGALVRAPFDETWPLQWLSDVSFEDHAGLSGGTVIRIEWTALDPTEAERRTFDAERERLDSGWGGTFDRLAEFLADRMAPATP